MFPSSHGVVSQKRRRGSGPGPGVGAPLITSLGALTNVTAFQVGWRFTVGASPITVTHLRAYLREAANVRLCLWRAQYQQQIASVDVTSVVATWVDGELTQPVVLNAGEDYIVTAYKLAGGSLSAYRTPPEDVTVASVVTLVGTCTDSNIRFPATVDAVNFDGFTDLLHTVGGTPDPTKHLISSMPALSNPTSAFQVGWRFTVGANDLLARGARVYIGGTAEETIRLWRVSDQQLLASVAVTPPLSSLWTVGLFESPVTLTAGQQYVLTTRRTDGASRMWYTGTGANFGITADVTRNAAHAVNGDGYPGQDSSSALYGITDLVYEVL